MYLPTDIVNDTAVEKLEVEAHSALHICVPCVFICSAHRDFESERADNLNVLIVKSKNLKLKHIARYTYAFLVFSFAVLMSHVSTHIIPQCHMSHWGIIRVIWKEKCVSLQMTWHTWHGTHDMTHIRDTDTSLWAEPLSLWRKYWALLQKLTACFRNTLMTWHTSETHTWHDTCQGHICYMTHVKDTRTLGGISNFKGSQSFRRRRVPRVHAHSRWSRLFCENIGVIVEKICHR